MSELFNRRITDLCARFTGCQTPESRYTKIIELGRACPPLDAAFKTAPSRVSGCQSTMYLRVYQEGSLIFFNAEADSLIANGLGVLLTSVYSGLTAMEILSSPPTYLETLGIPASLSPSRANGLASLYLRMKQEALHLLLEGHLGQAGARSEELEAHEEFHN